MPQFIDTAKIWIQSGKGGDGKVSFHRLRCFFYNGQGKEYPHATVY